MEYQTKPDNNLVWAILCTLFCCLPLGIVSIVYAAKVDSLYSAGNYQGAKEASEKAKQYALYGAIAGVAIFVIYILFIVFASIAASH